MPRGRKPIRPAVPLPPRSANEPEAWIDAALMGWARDRHVRELAALSQRLRKQAPKPRHEPGRPRAPRRAASWIDSANHPRDPRQRGAPRDHYLPIVLKAIDALIEQRGWKLYRARRYTADRLLMLLPWELTQSILDIPEHVINSDGPEERHRQARDWLINQWKAAKPS